MLTWVDEKKSPTEGNAAGANAAEAASLGRTDYRPAAALGTPTLSDPTTPDAKTVSSFAAKFAWHSGHELRVIEKPGGRAYYEVRRWDECYTVGTVADLDGLLRQFGAVAA